MKSMNSKETCYLLVGLTDVYANPPAVPFERRERNHVLAAMEQTAKTLVELRRIAVPVIYLPRAYDLDGLNIEFMRREPFEKIKSQTQHWPAEKGLPTTLKYPTALAPLTEEVLILRRAFSGFFMTDLGLKLHQMKVKRVVVGGANASICVRATVYDAISYGFRVAVHGDSLADHDIEQVELAKSFYSNRLNIPVLTGFSEEWFRF